MKGIDKLHGRHHPLPVQALQQGWQSQLSYSNDAALLTASGPGKKQLCQNCIKVRESPGCMGTTFLQNDRNHSTNDKVSCPRRSECH
jgi:hypothetical protein